MSFSIFRFSISGLTANIRPSWIVHTPYIFIQSIWPVGRTAGRRATYPNVNETQKNRILLVYRYISQFLAETFIQFFFLPLEWIVMNALIESPPHAHTHTHVNPFEFGFSLVCLLNRTAHEINAKQNGWRNILERTQASTVDTLWHLYRAYMRQCVCRPGKHEEEV